MIQLSTIYVNEDLKICLPRSTNNHFNRDHFFGSLTSARIVQFLHTPASTFSSTPPSHIPNLLGNN